MNRNLLRIHQLRRFPPPIGVEKGISTSPAMTDISRPDRKMIMIANGVFPGTIHPEHLCTPEAFKRCVNISNATLRSARRAGLVVYRKHGRAFILGRDWIEYVTASPAVELPSLAIRSGT